MKKSKFIGKVYPGGWVCTDIYLFANYSQCTRHNSYKYLLSRITSDKKCDKIIIVSGNTMTKIDRGLICIDNIADRKKKSNKVLYKFI